MALDFFRFLKRSVLLLLLTCIAAQAQTNPKTCVQDCPAPFVNNSFWTTEYGPATANIVLSPTNFLACTSASYALCYYSGPDATPTGPNGHALPSLPCTVSKDGTETANCRCYAESGSSYVDIHAIRNTEAYVETIRMYALRWLHDRLLHL